MPAFLAHTDRVQYVENGEIVVLDADGVAIFDAAGEQVERAVESVDWDEETAEKGGYDTFMLKEIHEQAAGARRDDRRSHRRAATASISPSRACSTRRSCAASSA